MTHIHHDTHTIHRDTHDVHNDTHTYITTPNNPQVHFRSFPSDTLVPFDGPLSLRAAYMNALKVGYLKGVQ